MSKAEQEELDKLYERLEDLRKRRLSLMRDYKKLGKDIDACEQKYSRKKKTDE